MRGGKIIFGLAKIKGVGAYMTDQITAERAANGQYRNLTDFAKRTAMFLNKRILENFIKAGALDRFCSDRAKLYYNCDAMLLYAAAEKNSAQSLSLFDNTTEDDVGEDRLAKQLAASPAWGFNEQLAMETEAFGFSLQSSPLDPYKKLIDSQHLVKAGDLEKQGDKKSIRMAVNVTGFKRRLTKTGKQMMIINGTDGNANTDAVAFGDGVFELENILKENGSVVIAGRTAVREDNSVSLFVDTIIPIDEWAAMSAKKITLSIRDKTRMAELKALVDALPNGLAKMTLKILDGAKDTMSKLSGLGIKAEIE